MNLVIDNKTIAIDDIDEKIIAELLENSRISFSDLSEKIGISRVAVSNRVARLEEIGVIEKFTINLHYSYSRKKTSTYIELTVLPSRIAEVARIISEYKEIVVVYQMSGGCILHIHGFFDDIEEIQQFIENNLKHIEGIQNIKIEFILKKYKSDFV